MAFVVTYPAAFFYLPLCNFSIFAYVRKFFHFVFLFFTICLYLTLFFHFTYFFQLCFCFYFCKLICTFNPLLLLNLPSNFSIFDSVRLFCLFLFVSFGVTNFTNLTFNQSFMLLLKAYLKFASFFLFVRLSFSIFLLIFFHFCLFIHIKQSDCFLELCSVLLANQLDTENS